MMPEALGLAGFLVLVLTTVAYPLYERHFQRLGDWWVADRQGWPVARLLWVIVAVLIGAVGLAVLWFAGSDTLR